MDVKVRRVCNLPMDLRPIEIVERKGKGHPDSICDSVMNQVSLELSKYYLEKFGRILHHNIDKGLLAAGSTVKKFGGGDVVEPMLMVFGDRATSKVGDMEIPVGEITVKAAKEWIRENMRFVDPDKHLRYQVEIKRGSEALTDIFERSTGLLGANDTSASVGYAPLSRLERLILGLEKWLNSREFKKEHPESGEDIKIMGHRVNDKVTLTVAMAFVDRFIDGEDDYFKKKKEIEEQMHRYVNEFIERENWKCEYTINFNPLDVRGRGIKGLYLSVLGTSAEDGDSGQVGRGNMVNGVIPLNRPTSSEAAAGKNPVSHVGKIYNILTFEMAKRIVNNIPDIEEAYVWLLSKIGTPIDKPQLTAVEVSLKPNADFKNIKREIDKIMESELEGIGGFVEKLARGEYSVC